MSIEVGGAFNNSQVWEDKTEWLHEDCVGVTNRPRSSVMCQGMIGNGSNGQF